MGTTDQIQVLLVDDQTMIRQGMRYVIDIQEDMQVVGQAGNGAEAISIVKKTQPDVILMDVQMPVMDGIQATKEILSVFPDIRIVILTTFDAQEYVVEGIRSGAVGYLLKAADTEEMLSAIRSAARGEAVYKTASAAVALATAISSSSANQTRDNFQLIEALTEREQEVLQQMSYGKRNDQIAKQLVISEGTVKTHVHRILQKMGVEDRTQAVVIAIRHGIVQ